jgi:WD40 repeat protein
MSSADDDEEERSLPDLLFKCQIVELAFHPDPEQRILASGLIDGSVCLHKYAADASGENEELFKMRHHKKGCRSIDFNSDGKSMYTSSKDQSIASLDSETGTLIGQVRKSLFFYWLYHSTICFNNLSPRAQLPNAHDAAVNRVRCYDDNVLISGCDEGGIKVSNNKHITRAFISVQTPHPCICPSARPTARPSFARSSAEHITSLLPPLPAS